MRAGRLFPLRRGSIVLLGLLLALHAPRYAYAHPLHTTLGELRYSPSTGAVQLTLRVFADDFSAVIWKVRQARLAAGRSEIGSTAEYLGRHLELRGPDRRRVALRPVGMRRQGLVFWITLRGSAPAGISGGSLRNTLMFDRFDDQVNIVQVKPGAAPQTLLFTPGDAAKRLR